MKASVYWIHRSSHTDINTEGYVGVSSRVEERFKQHIHAINQNSHNLELIECWRESPNEISFDVVFEGDEDQCYVKEKELRPKSFIGWNKVPGGKRGDLEYFHSEEWSEFCSRRLKGNQHAKGNKGKPKSAEHRRKISLGNRGKIHSEERRRRHSEVMKGRTLTEEHKKKIGSALKGRKQSPELIAKRMARFRRSS